MAEWDRAKALAALEAFKLTGANAEVASYWLSLWDGDRPPNRAAFDPNHLRDQLPAIALMQVAQNGDTICRLSGRFIDAAMGMPMRGVSMLDLVEGEERKLRSQRLGAIVAGQIGLSHTRFETDDHEPGVAETIQLPFFGMMEDGTRRYLTHTNWRPGADYLARERPRYDGRPDRYFAFSIQAE
jgi:hypothetical protein